jgi:predicted DNA-binding protein
MRKTRLSFTVKPEYAEKLQELADKQGRSVASLVQEAIANYLKDK